MGNHETGTRRHYPRQAENGSCHRTFSLNKEFYAVSF